ncbi:forkhead activin signal transducer 3-like [Haliotis asinina]|uniref:forkhead activin signal transducer 3-like n=1 Tax=Haliotis asinina TaxID=109174 RepID=UPI0035320029
MDITSDRPCQSMKRCREDEEDGDVLSSKCPDSAVPAFKRRQVKYQRHGKPPYTYLGMMVVAIQSTADKRLTLVEIQNALEDMFPFFQGQYKGWKDSVRHNLSHNPCFNKSSRAQTKKKSSNGCFWTVDLSLVPGDAFKRSRVPNGMEELWAPTLTKQLNIPDIHLPPPRTPPKKVFRIRSKKQTTAENDCVHSPDETSTRDPGIALHTPSPSLSYTEAQYTRYLREQTPDGVPLSKYPPFASLLYHTTTSSDVTAAAENLRNLCPSPRYGTPFEDQRTSESASPQDLFSYATVIEELFPTSGTAERHSLRVTDSSSPDIAPDSADPFMHYLADLTTVPESFSFPSQLTTVCSNSLSDSTCFPIRYEAVSPKTPKTSEGIQYPGVLPTLAPPAPPSDCSTISFVSEVSQISTVSLEATLPTDFSTVSFDNIKDEPITSLPDIFA